MNAGITGIERMFTNTNAGASSGVVDFCAFANREQSSLFSAARAQLPTSKWLWKKRASMRATASFTGVTQESQKD